MRQPGFIEADLEYPYSRIGIERGEIMVEYCKIISTTQGTRVRLITHTMCKRIIMKTLNIPRSNMKNHPMSQT